MIILKYKYHRNSYIINNKLSSEKLVHNYFFSHIFIYYLKVGRRKEILQIKYIIYIKQNTICPL